MITANEALILSNKNIKERKKAFNKEINEVRKDLLEKLQARIIENSYESIDKKIKDVVLNKGTAEYLKTIGYEVRCREDVQGQRKVYCKYDISWEKS